jgi:hypothetical protein
MCHNLIINEYAHHGQHRHLNERHPILFPRRENEGEDGLSLLLLLFSYDHYSIREASISISVIAGCYVLAKGFGAFLAFSAILLNKKAFNAY